MTPRRAERGSTLPEALVALALLGLLMVGAFTGLATLQILGARARGRAEVQQHGRVALDRMARELRVSGYDLSGVIPTLPSPRAIQTAEASRLTIVGDVDRDGTLDKVTFRLSADRLLREVSAWNGTSFPAATADVLGTGFSTLDFSYHDGNDTALSAPVATSSLSDIRRITVALVTTASTLGQEASMPLVEDVRVRNLCEY
jgi:type II secretory pathway component PulJ